jgi:hypothetical protein
VSNLAFRDGTPFITVNATVPYALGIAPGNSASVSEAFYTTTINLVAGSGVYAMMSGLRNPAGYTPNPEGKDISFMLDTCARAKTTAFIAKNVDVMYYHGITDMPPTKMYGFNNVNFISKNDTFGQFHGYTMSAALDNLEFNLVHATNDTTLINSIGNLSYGKGQTALVYATGIVTPEHRFSKELYPRLFVIYPDGSRDSIHVTAVKENVLDESAVNMYPNPASHTLGVKWEMTAAAGVSIGLMDLMGRKVQNLHEGRAVMGVNELRFDISDLNPGVYLCTLEADGARLTRKIMVIR